MMTLWENLTPPLSTKRRLQARLPDGMFPYQNLQFWYILRGLGIKIEMVHWYLVVFWYIIGTF
jgi:hypothetical protein